MNNKIGISLGWNCNSAIEGIKLGIRKTKQQGYLTCPFDEMISNYEGIIKCIETDFKYFCDINYLELVNKQKNTLHINTVKDDEKLIRNNYYNFLFNHESPDHANLFIEQKWINGKNHFINNNYEKFKERYNNRIENFRNYLQDSNNYIIFILHRYNTNENNITELKNVLKLKYPLLKYEFYFLDIHYNQNIIKEHLIFCGLNENNEEVLRLDVCVTRT